MFRNPADQTIPIEDRSVVVDVPRNDPDLRVAGQRRLEAVRLIVGEHVEIPDGAPSGVVPVEAAREIYFPGVFVDDERAIVNELPGEAVSNVRLPIDVRICGSNLLIMEIIPYCINPFVTGDAYMRQLFHCLQ